MKYKGYTGVVELEEGSDVLFGRVIGLRDVITFQGESVAEVTQAFHDSVDDYLEFCAERGESPEKTYSGQFVLRLDRKLHRDLAVFAERLGVSLNTLIEGMLRGESRPRDRNRLPAHRLEAQKAIDMDDLLGPRRPLKGSGKKKSTR
jgi:predicted HicB family RNase H-like nuclease